MEMDINLEKYRDDELLQSVQMTLQQWKWAESYYGDGNLCIAKILKRKYLLLLMEVRKRNLSLTPEQLLSSILWKAPSKGI